MKKYLALASTVVAALALGVAAGAPAVAAGTTTVTVHVTSAGKPLAGADVTLQALTGGGTQDGQTASNGVVTYSDVAPDKYTVLVNDSDKGFLPTYAGSTVREVDATILTVKKDSATSLTIKAVAGATLKGKVLDAKGHALARAHVSVWNANRAGYGDAVTDAKGQYVVRGLASGPVSLSVVSSKNVELAQATATAKQGATTTVRTMKVAVRTAKITGTVKTTGSKAAPSVSLLGKNSYASVKATTSGKVTFSGLVAGTYTVVVDGANLAKKVTVKAGKSASFGTLSRGKLSTISGVVKTSAKKLAPNAYVQLTDGRGLTAGETLTDSKGRYTIKGLVSGKYTVTVYPTRQTEYFAFAAVTAKSGKGLVKNVTLAKGSTVTGYVKHAGKPVEDAWVSIGAGYAVTDAKGKYSIQGVAPGTATIQVGDQYTGGYHVTTKKVAVKKGKALTAPLVTVK